MLVTRAVDATKLALDNPHPRDAHVTFEEDTHTYFVRGVAVSQSVTGLLHVVEEDFDVVTVSERVAAARVPNPRYCTMAPDGTVVRMSAEAIRASWQDTNRLGTDLHGKIERYLNGMDVDVPDDDVNSVPFQQFKAWLVDVQGQGYVPYRTEWVIYDDEADLAGSIDCVFRHDATDTYMVIDWKRCLTYKSSGFDSAYNDRACKPPLQHVLSTKLNKWRLQVNVYREILERYYGVTITKMAMVVLHPENAAAEVHWHERDTESRMLLNHKLGTLGKPPRELAFPPAPRVPTASTTTAIASRADIGRMLRIRGL